jgi:hypothetical protein
MAKQMSWLQRITNSRSSLQPAVSQELLNKTKTALDKRIGELLSRNLGGLIEATSEHTLPDYATIGTVVSGDANTCFRKIVAGESLNEISKRRKILQRYFTEYVGAEDAKTYADVIYENIIAILQPIANARKPQSHSMCA